MSAKHGIKETKEVLTLIGVFGVAVIRRLKDGFQSDDITKLLEDPELIKAVKEGFQGSGLVLNEIKDLNFIEGIDLGRHGYKQIDSVLDALKA